ncbi:hypothetical protein [Roseateles chitosanitabidus]|uniref:hypothetical protein n=1 Tax=Roseateles chitosanitabidus TaxID=65048 RepID=UPI000836D6D9|nr:hypothetical protein [Roseateles chitosanitabidus]
MPEAVDLRSRLPASERDDLTPEQLAYKRLNLPIPSQAEIDRMTVCNAAFREEFDRMLALGSLAGREPP